eukprot:20429_1
MMNILQHMMNGYVFMATDTQRCIHIQQIQKHWSVIHSNGTKIKVKYLGYSAKYDEWLRLDGDRFAPLCTYTTNPEKLRTLIGTKCDVYDKTIKQWWPCSVISSRVATIKVRYDGYSANYDEWIRVHGDRYAALHTHTTDTKALVGTKCDVYDKTIKQWWPCSVINSSITKIKVRYVGYSDKYDEWIRVKFDRYA